MGTLSGVPATQDSTDIPVIASSVIAGSGVVANAVATATMAAMPTVTAYITGFQITAGGATAAKIVAAALSGVAGGTVSYVFGFPAGVTTAALNLAVTFYPAIPASGPNTAIALSLPAGGSGNTAAAVSVQGFYL